MSFANLLAKGALSSDPFPALPHDKGELAILGGKTSEQQTFPLSSGYFKPSCLLFCLGGGCDSINKHLKSFTYAQNIQIFH